MDYLNYYLISIQEKLEDIKIDKRKWFDIINLELRTLYQKEIKRIFEKHFIIRHPIIDNRKTEISVSRPLLGYVFYIEIKLFDKKGKDIIDYEHEGNTFGQSLVIQLIKKGNKWELYYHTLFLKSEYQGKKLGPTIVKTIDSSMQKLQQTREAWYQASDVGRYVWSRRPKVKFKNRSGLHSHNHVENQYQKWCKLQNKKCKSGRLPSDYPKEYLLSDYSPEFIDYLVPL